METTLTKDLAELICVDKHVIDKLAQNVNYCICNYVEKAMLDNESVCKIDIGIGELTLVIENDSMTWHFTPSQELENEVVTTLETQQNPLTLLVTKKLINQLDLFYDRMF